MTVNLISNILDENKADIHPQMYKQLLCKWYKENQRSLPWRALTARDANPYYVLVSEFMLQQTTVQSVVPYFYRFIERFPTIQTLAAASMDDVAVLWQGLGYYSRAKNLLASAREIVMRQQQNGRDYFPSLVEDLLSLPGVGPYTGAAVAAIAFDKAVVPVDGNVMRVVSRLFAMREPKGPLLNACVTKQVKAFADVCDNDQLAQGLMELGALVCRPKNAQCEVCPLKGVCSAYVLGQVDSFPVVGKKLKRDYKEGQAHIVMNEHNEVLLLRRPAKGLFANLHVLPMTWLDAHFPFEHINILYEFPASIRHVFTHFDLDLSVVKSQISLDCLKDISTAKWAPLNQLEGIAMPTLMRKVFKLIDA